MVVEEPVKLDVVGENNKTFGIIVVRSAVVERVG